MSGGGGGAAVRGRVSSEQLEALLAFMEEHAEFALGKQSVYSRYSASKLWRLLAERLNALAAHTQGARKSPDKWCRYWSDLKYKARKKCAAAGELSLVEERLRAILAGSGGGGGGGGGGREASAAGRGGRALSPDSGGGGGGLSDDALSGSGAAPPDELLAEAAMRQALAAEKQAEAVAQGVELLRELVCVVRERLPPAPPAGAAPAAPLGHDHDHAHGHDALAALHHHHHRL